MGRQSLVKQRRREILKAFHSIARSEGLKGANVRAVAQRAGVKPSIIYHFFESKQELIEQTVLFVAERHTLAYGALSEGAKERDALLQITAEYLFNEEMISDDSGLYYDLWGEGKRNKKIEKNFRNVYRTFRSGIVKTMKLLPAATEKTEKEYQDFAAVVVALFLGAYVQADFDRKSVDLQKMREFFIKSAGDFLES